MATDRLGLAEHWLKSYQRQVASVRARYGFAPINEDAWERNRGALAAELAEAENPEPGSLPWIFNLCHPRP